MIKLFAWLRAALTGKAESPPVVEAKKPRVEPVTMQINVDTSELQAALALLEQIKVAAEDAGPAMILAELKGLRKDLAEQHAHESYVGLRVTS